MGGREREKERGSEPQMDPVCLSCAAVRLLHLIEAFLSSMANIWALNPSLALISPSSPTQHKSMMPLPLLNPTKLIQLHHLFQTNCVSLSQF